jgi:UDP-3-O-[3-hydroxymyristoyl] glucosamine N-acyltransferase
MPGAFIGNHVPSGRTALFIPMWLSWIIALSAITCLIQSNTTIGSDAFYYNKKTTRDVHYKKMLSCGRVVIEDT